MIIWARTSGRSSPNCTLTDVSDSTKSRKVAKSFITTGCVIGVKLRPEMRSRQGGKISFSSNVWRPSAATAKLRKAPSRACCSFTSLTRGAWWSFSRNQTKKSLNIKSIGMNVVISREKKKKRRQISALRTLNYLRNFSWNQNDHLFKDNFRKLPLGLVWELVRKGRSIHHSSCWNNINCPSKGQPSPSAEHPHLLSTNLKIK